MDFVSALFGFLGSLFVLLFPIALIVLFFYAHAVHRKRVRRMRERNFDWYRTNNPRAVSGDAVRCCNCDSTRVHARSVMNKTYMREHFCTRCGTTLYYSPEPI